MKVPSIVRLPKYKSFSYEPRHYDPIKEEIEERTERIRRELEAENLIEKREDEEGQAKTHSAASISFRRKERSNNNATLLQLAIAALLGALVVGWLYYGDKIFYSLFLIFPVYIYFRFKGRFGKGK